MGIQVRNIGYQKSNEPSLQKATGLLSDGVTRVLLLGDANQAGVTGDGGDNTGIPKYYLYSSTDGTTWTLRQTISVTGATTNRMVGSMAIAANDNIHLLYKDSDLSMKYRLLTRSGATWTVGAAEAVMVASPAGEWYDRADIDAIGTGNNAVATIMHHKSTATAYYRLETLVRTNTPAWVAATAQTIITGDYEMAYTEEISVAGDQTAIAGDFLTTAMCAITRKVRSGEDTGDWIYAMRINVSTGAVTFSKVTGSLNSGRGGGFRKTRVFNENTDQYWLAGLCNPDDTEFFVLRYSINRSTLVATTLAAVTRYKPATVTDRTQSQYNWNDVMYCGNRKFLFMDSNVYRRCVALTLSTSYSPTWSPSNNFEGTYNAGPSSVPSVNNVRPAQMWIGTNRNYQATIILTATSFYSSSAAQQPFAVQWFEKPNPLAGTLLSPGAGTSTISSLPTLKGSFKYATATPAVRAKLQFQIASDAGFTTNVRTVTEADTDLFYPNNATSGTAVTASEATPAGSALFQGIWFIRQRTVDELGAFGPYSASVSFTVAHKPVAANLSPTGGAIFQYGTGQVTFSWTFTDPSPGDTQTAYQVIVSDANTNAVIVDSTKVTSTAGSTTLTIPGTAKDIDLQWTVTLWDGDNVAGNPSDPQLFLLTDQPAPVITVPTASQVFGSANPIITWNPGISAAKTQTAYRVLITSGVITVYDPGWITSGSSSHAVPTGYLTNTTSYTVQVWVRDNFNLEGTATQLFSTNWTPPTTRSLQSVYLSEYARRGYVYLTWDPTIFDVDFLAWKIYRRPYGTSAWTLIAYVTKTSDIAAFKDYTAASGTTYQYILIQVADRNGDYVEAAIGTIMTVTPQANGYWILHQTNDSLSFPLFSVTSDDFSEEYESETYHVIGRGRHTDYGDRLGYKGSMEVQLRDQALTGTPRTNFVINPALSYAADPGPTPQGWTLVTSGTVGTISEDYIQTQDPPPTNVDSIYRVQASGLGTLTTDLVRIEQVIILDQTFIVGDTATFSIWVNDVQGVLTQRRIEIGMQWETAAAAVVRNDTASAPTAVATYTSNAAGTPDFGSTSNPVTGQWKRYAISNTVPATATQVRIRVLMAGNGTGATAARSLIVTGAQLEEGSLTNYFDGRQLGAAWVGNADLSTSFTTGYITARAQRLRLEAMKAERTAVYLRSPFGDLFTVNINDISVKRIAGTGTTEITDVTLPYEEVAF